MNILKIIGAFLFLLLGGLVFITLGFTALTSPKKLVNFNLKFVRKMKYFEKLKRYNIRKAEQGDSENAWRKSGAGFIFVGLFFIYALIFYFEKLFK